VITRIIKIYNNIIYDIANGSNTDSVGIYIQDGWEATIYNNTIYNSYDCINIGSGASAVLRNNIVQQCTHDGFEDNLVPFSAASDYNISNIASDAPSPSYRSTMASTVTFVDAAGADYHLSTSNTLAIEQGTDLSTDGTLDFSTDVDGETRPKGVRWDIGADEADHILFQQEGYRFRNDNGSETTATWLAAQDTDIFHDKTPNTRLRVLVNVEAATDTDPNATPFRLEYKKSTESTYKKVINTQYATITVRSERTGTATTNASNGRFTVNVPSNIENGDYLVTIIGKRDDPDIAPPSGWTTGDEQGDTTGNDVFGGIYYKYVTNAAGETAPYTFDSAGTSEPVMYWIGALSGIDVVTPEDVDFSSGSGNWANLQDDTTPNVPSVTTVTGSAFALAVWVVNNDTSTTQPGGSWASRADDVGSMNVVSQTFPTAATATGTPEITGVAALQETQVGTFVFRPQRHAITLSASSNISVSGTNTTAQLAAPSGKTTANFTTGRIQDDENPADAVDIQDNGYTEMEWSLTATGTAQYLDVYQFRVTTTGTTFNTYSVTPQWTIRAPSGPVHGAVMHVD